MIGFTFSHHLLVKTSQLLREFYRLNGSWLALLIGSVIDHFTVVCLVSWPLNESEARVVLVLIETSLLFLS